MKNMLQQLPLKMSQISKKALKISQMAEKLGAAAPVHSFAEYHEILKPEVTGSFLNPFGI